MPGGILYVVATPIGNLEDITLRALRVLREVDLIAAEDTRHTRVLLSRHGISRPLTSYYDAVERARAPAIVEKLKAGARVALVSDAGTPGIADPGYHLVRGALAAGVPTKRHEEVLRGTLAELAERVAAMGRVRGEVTILVGARAAPEVPPATPDLDARIRTARAAGRSVADLAAEIARETGVPRRA